MAVLLEGGVGAAGGLPGESETVGEGGGDGSGLAEVIGERLGAFRIVLGEADEGEGQGDLGVAGLNGAGGFERALGGIEFAEAEVTKAEVVGGGLHGVAGGEAAFKALDGGAQQAPAEADQAKAKPGFRAGRVQGDNTKQPGLGGGGALGTFVGEGKSPQGIDGAGFERDGALAERDAVFDASLFPMEQGEVEGGLPGGGLGIHGGAVGRRGGFTIAEALVGKGENEQGREGLGMEKKRFFSPQDRLLVVTLVEGLLRIMEQGRPFRSGEGNAVRRGDILDFDQQG